MIERPSRRGKRPRALDITFGIDDPDDDSATTSDASRKRASDAIDADLRVRAWIFHLNHPG